MQDIIRWCNENEGFTNATLTCATVLISIVAIIISIKTAKLPYKKKMKLSGGIGLAIGQGIESIAMVGYYVTACNVGNRSAKITFLGLALSKPNKRFRNEMDLLHNLQRSNKPDKPLRPSETFEVEYNIEKLVVSLEKYGKDRLVYLYVSDTEGTITKKKIGTIEQFLKQFKS